MPTVFNLCQFRTYQIRHLSGRMLDHQVFNFSFDFEWHNFLMSQCVWRDIICMYIEGMCLFWHTYHATQLKIDSIWCGVVFWSKPTKWKPLHCTITLNWEAENLLILSKPHWFWLLTKFLVKFGQWIFFVN